MPPTAAADISQMLTFRQSAAQRPEKAEAPPDLEGVPVVGGHALGRCRVTASTIGILRSSAGPHGKRSRGLPDRERLNGRCQRGPVGGTVRQQWNWDLRHRKSSLVIRLLLAVWITVVVVVLCATGRWWGLVFVVPLVLDLYLLRRILAAGSGR